MKLPDRLLVDSRTFGCFSALFLSGVFVVGCVSLSKPANVSKNCPTSSAPTCTGDPNRIVDAAKDGTVDNASSDLPYGPEVPVVKPDAGPEVSPSEPDTAPDQADSATVNNDTKGGDARDLSDGTDTAPPPSDLPADKVSGTEPGPESQGAEPGAEPSSGPEPGPEPGRESGPESGPEPAPEPPRDGSATDGSSAACANATPLTGGNGSTGGFGTTNAFCFVTCDSMQYGWGCDSFTEATRTVTVNGTSVTCGGTLPAKKSGYYYFAIAAGGHTWDAIHWSGTAATSCPAPAGGFSP
jgi:hypothetical protein